MSSWPFHLWSEAQCGPCLQLLLLPLAPFHLYPPAPWAALAAHRLTQLLQSFAAQKRPPPIHEPPAQPSGPHATCAQAVAVPCLDSALGALPSAFAPGALRSLGSTPLFGAFTFLPTTPHTPAPRSLWVRLFSPRPTMPGFQSAMCLGTLWLRGPCSVSAFWRAFRGRVLANRQVWVEPELSVTLA